MGQSACVAMPAWTEQTACTGGQFNATDGLYFCITGCASSDTRGISCDQVITNCDMGSCEARGTQGCNAETGACVCNNGKFGLTFDKFSNCV